MAISIDVTLRKDNRSCILSLGPINMLQISQANTISVCDNALWLLVITVPVRSGLECLYAFMACESFSPCTDSPVIILLTLSSSRSSFNRVFILSAVCNAVYIKYLNSLKLVDDLNVVMHFLVMYCVIIVH